MTCPTPSSSDADSFDRHYLVRMLGTARPNAPAVWRPWTGLGQTGTCRSGRYVHHRLYRLVGLLSVDLRVPERWARLIGQDPDLLARTHARLVPVRECCRQNCCRCRNTTPKCSVLRVDLIDG